MEPLGPPAGGRGGVAKIHKKTSQESNRYNEHKRYRIKVNN